MQIVLNLSLFGHQKGGRQMMMNYQPLPAKSQLKIAAAIVLLVALIGFVIWLTTKNAVNHGATLDGMPVALPSENGKEAR